MRTRNLRETKHGKRQKSENERTFLLLTRGRPRRGRVGVQPVAVDLVGHLVVVGGLSVGDLDEGTDEVAGVTQQAVRLFAQVETFHDLSLVSSL